MNPIEATKSWLEKAVIGLNLCPFAKAVHAKQQIHWVLSEARDPATLMNELVTELQFLADSRPEAIETTILVHPHVLGDFLDFNDFLGAAENTLDGMGLDGSLQIASFHPNYRFAGTEADEISNFSNRSPHPTLHLLREDSIARAVAAVPDAERIYERNIETLEALGHAGWQRVMAG
jgi:hypothetical protein